MKGMRVIAIVFLAGAGCLAARAPAASAPAVPATQPAGSPREIAALIRQLGDDSFRVRQDAAKRLREIGKAALPALKEAEKSSDLEIHNRARNLVQDLQQPAEVPGPFPRTAAYSTQSVSVSVNNGARRVDVLSQGRTIHIEQDAAGIRMKVTGLVKKQKVTREYKAANAEQLKTENPPAYALYNKWINGGAGGNTFNANNGGIILPGNVNINGGIIQGLRPPLPMPPQFVPPQFHRPGGDDLEKLQQNLLDQMRNAKTSPPDQEKVKGLLKQMEEALPPAFDGAGGEVDAQMREYNRECDALRKQLRELKLPDPGDVLPPPAAGRLGIAATEESVAGEGLAVTHVLPDSRAARIGLKEQDVIQKVNDKDVHSTHQLREMVTANLKGLTIEGLRDGKPFKVREK
ncbi:MAG TPA: PDZ domain-containing protein [Tepidisphaeraceae bacterium]|nr:PDZ domain-containing protein [Tepidisphaeraceae bacterium]